MRPARWLATAHTAWVWVRPRSTISRRYSSARAGSQCRAASPARYSAQRSTEGPALEMRPRWRTSPEEFSRGTRPVYARNDAWLAKRDRSPTTARTTPATTGADAGDGEEAVLGVELGVQGGDAVLQASDLAGQETELCQRKFQLEADRREVDVALVEGDRLANRGAHRLGPLGAPVAL